MGVDVPPVLFSLALDQLIAVLQRSIAWLDELPNLLPANNEDACHRWGAPSVNAVEDKVVTEFATLLHVAARVRNGYLSAPVKQLRSRLVDIGRPRRHLDLMRLAPHCAWPLGITHAILTYQGVPDPGYDAVLRNCVATGWHAAVDRPAFRAMEMRWATAIWLRRRPCVADLWPRAGWGQLPAFLARREDGYALTHAMLYATDFGKYQLSQRSSSDSIAEIVDAYLADRLWADDLDLVGELVLSALCARIRPRYLTTALSVMFGSCQDGVIPGPGVRVGASLSEEAAFTCCYHTTLVSGLVAATLLHCGDFGEAISPQPALVAKETLKLLALAMPDDDELGASWVTLVDDVPDDPENVLNCVRDGAVAHACRRLRVSTMHALLAARPGYRTALPTLTECHAQSWLDRQLS